jgi:hypothetical protein
MQSAFLFLLWVVCFSSLTIYFEVIVSNKITPTAPLRETVNGIHVCHYLSFTVYFISVVSDGEELDW